MNERESVFTGFTGCSNHSCVVKGKRKGMGTNGPCHCVTDATRTQLNMLSQRLDKHFTDLEAAPSQPAQEPVAEIRYRKIKNLELRAFVKNNDFFRDANRSCKILNVYASAPADAQRIIELEAEVVSEQNWAGHYANRVQALEAKLAVAETALKSCTTYNEYEQDFNQVLVEQALQAIADKG